VGGRENRSRQKERSYALPIPGKGGSGLSALGALSRTNCQQSRATSPVPGLPQLLVCDLINHYRERAAHVCAHAEIQLGRADGLIERSKTGENHTICHRSAPCAV